MNLRFLTPAGAGTGPGPSLVARSPMEHASREAGARFEVREGWNVAVDFPERTAPAATAAGWTDVSHLAKLELQGPVAELGAIVAELSGLPPAALGSAARARGSWWCPVTPERTLVLTSPADAAGLRERAEVAAAAAPGWASVTDITSVLAALTIIGPGARELIARFCSLDLRPHVTPPSGFRPGSVARVPGYILCEAVDRYLLLFGWAVGHYVWTVVADAGQHLGGRAVGADALPALDAVPMEAASRA